MISIIEVPFDEPRAQTLWAEQQVELAQIYGEPDIHPQVSADGVIVSLLALDAAGTPVGTVFARWSHYHPGDPVTGEPNAAEVKRLYVIPAARGNAFAALLMQELEARVWASGAARIVLETGVLQPAAIATYERLGYERIDNFGPYEDEEDSVCMGKERPV